MNKTRIGLLVAASFFACPAIAFAQPEEEPIEASVQPSTQSITS